MRWFAVLPLILLLPLALCGAQDDSYTPRMKRVEPTTGARIEAIQRGIDYLLQTQNADGSWSDLEKAWPDSVYMGTVASFQVFEAASSALCCMALMEADSLNLATRDSLKKGMEFLLRVEPLRRSTADELYSIWGITYVSQALVRGLAFAEPLAIPRERLEKRLQLWFRQLERHQSIDGGWGYYDFEAQTLHPAGDHSTSFLTGAILLMLREAERAGIAIPEKARDLGLLSLQRLRNPDGTFIYGNYARLRAGVQFNQVKGSLGRSINPTLALLRYQHGGVEMDDLLTVMNRFFEHRHFLEIARARPIPHETWYKNAGYYYCFGHFYAAEAIREMPAAMQAPYWEKLIPALLNSQQQDGSWWDWQLYGYNKYYGTGFCLAALIAAFNADPQTAAHNR